jgi:hypothetical protein
VGKLASAFANASQGGGYGEELLVFQEGNYDRGVRAERLVTCPSIPRVPGTSMIWMNMAARPKLDPSLKSFRTRRPSLNIERGARAWGER